MSITRIIYKTLGILLVLYGLIYGMIAEFPIAGSLERLEQSGRNIFYHVPMWFAVLAMMGTSVFYSLKYLRMTGPDASGTGDPLFVDASAKEAAVIGSIFNALGLITGMIWSRVTWGSELPDTDLSAWWLWDPVQVCALIALLIYLAYFLLRSSFAEPEQRARAAAVYNIFAFATLIPLFFIIPKMLDGLHPTAQKGSFVFKKGEIDNAFRMILYPTMFGFILLSVWMLELRRRMQRVRLRMENWQADQEYEGGTTLVDNTQE